MSPGPRFIREQLVIQPTGPGRERMRYWASILACCYHRRGWDKARNEDHFHTQQQSLMTFVHPEIGPAIRRGYPIQPWRQGVRLVSEICDIIYFWDESWGCVVMAIKPTTRVLTVTLYICSIFSSFVSENRGSVCSRKSTLQIILRHFFCNSINGLIIVLSAEPQIILQ